MSEINTANFEQGARIVRCYLHLGGCSAAKPVDEDLDRGIELLESCDDMLWEAKWLLGKAFEAKGDFHRSAREFFLAFEGEPNHTAVIHELLIALLRINENQRAVEIARCCASRLEPQLWFDLALVESTFIGRQGFAINILDSIEWPTEFADRVMELRERLSRNSTRLSKNKSSHQKS
jgi:hypothetical protein